MSTSVTRTELAEIIGRKTLHQTDLNELVKSIAAYMVTESKPVDIDSLVRDVMQYRLERGMVEAVVASAHPLTPAVVADIEALLKDRYPSAKTVKIDNRIDQNLVGGVRVELPHETLDLSVRSKLNMFKRLVAEERN